MTTVTRKREIMEFQQEVRNCDELIIGAIKSLKNGNPLAAGHTAMKILGTSNRIKKAGEGLFSPHESPKENRELNDLLTVRQSDVTNLAKALKNGSEFLSFAETYGEFVKKTDAQILSICGQRITPGDFGNFPDNYPADPKA